MWEAGACHGLMRTLLDGGYLHGDCITVTGKTLAENLRGVTFNAAQEVMRPTTNPLAPMAGGGVVGLSRQSRAPEGGVSMKVAA